MPQREQQRAVVLTRVVAGAWTQREAAVVLGLSERQVRRLVATYRERGPAGLVHGNRGRAPGHALPAGVREQVVALARGKYAGAGDQHLTEKLAEAQVVLEAFLHGGPLARHPLSPDGSMSTPVPLGIRIARYAASEGRATQETEATSGGRAWSSRRWRC